jgi:hypothetical protein
MRNLRMTVIQTQIVLEISSSEENDDENDIWDLGPDPSVDGFCEKDRQPSIPLFIGNPVV